MSNYVSIKVDDHTQQVKDVLQQKVSRGLWAIGATAEGYAKDNCPVDTGRLRNSITFATSDKHSDGALPAKPEDYAEKGEPDAKEVYIGTNVEYAPYIELGTSKTTAHHMLRDAISHHVDEYKQLLEDSLKN